MKKNIEDIRKAVYNFNAKSDIGDIKTLLNSAENAKGDFYKATYTLSYSDDYDRDNLDPAGNNLLLHLISKGAFNKDNKLKNSVQKLALFVIDDAKSKLKADDFKKFINFNYSQDKDWYKNSPLTLAVKCGLLEVAECLVKEGADLLQHVPSSYGYYTPLHMLFHRMPFIDSKQEDALDKNTKLIKTIIKANKLSVGAKDLYKHKPQEIMGYKFPQHTDIKNLQIKNSDLLKNSGLKGNIYYSFKELMVNDAIKDFLKNQGVQSVDFKNLIKISTMPDENGRNVFYNDKTEITESFAIYQNIAYDETLDSNKLNKLYKPDIYSNYIENKKDDKVGVYRDQQKNDGSDYVQSQPFEKFIFDDIDEIDFLAIDFSNLIVD